jgi:hypothetical protein
LGGYVKESEYKRKDWLAIEWGKTEY